jgi:histone H4
MGVRHKKPSKSPLEAVGKPAIRRLARRGGVKRISAEVYQSMRDTANAYLDSVVERALLYLECRVGKNGGVLTATDVIYALKSTTHGGVTFYSDVP